MINFIEFAKFKYSNTRLKNKNTFPDIIQVLFVMGYKNIIAKNFNKCRQMFIFEYNYISHSYPE